MNFQQYFRIPKSQRLSRRKLADQLSTSGHKVTAAGVGYWVKHGVPHWWAPLVQDEIDKFHKGKAGAPVVIIRKAIA